MRMALSFLLIAFLIFFMPVPAGSQGTATQVETPPPPAGVFNLTLQQTKTYSKSLNFEVVGHNYFKVEWRTPYAKLIGLGSGFNTPRVYDGIAYLGGYAGPPTLYGVIVADVHDPENIKPLAFIPCNSGARCPYVRVNTKRQILVGTHDTNADNPVQPPAGQAVRAGVSFTDVSDPGNPKPLGFLLTRENGATTDLRSTIGMSTRARTRPKARPASPAQTRSWSSSTTAMPATPSW